MAVAWLALLCGHRLSFGLRAVAALIITYLLAILLLLRVGPISTGLPILFCFSVIGAMLFGRRGALLTWLVSALTLAGILFYLDTGGWDADVWIKPVTRLAMVAINYLLFSGLVSIGVAVLLHGLCRPRPSPSAWPRRTWPASGPCWPRPT